MAILLLSVALLLVPVFVGLAAEASDNKGTLFARGKAAVDGYCGLCHVVPDPQLLDRKTWLESILPEMKPGGSLATPLAGPGALEFTEDTNPLILARLFAPPLDEGTWEDIEEYFRSSAPVKLPAAKRPHPVSATLPEFDVEWSPRVSADRLRVTAIRIDEQKRRILLGTHIPTAFAVHDESLKPLLISNVGKPPTWIERRTFPNGRTQLTLTIVGDLDPNNLTSGFVMALDEQPGVGYYRNPHPLRLQFRRPVHTQWGDLDGDGLQDAVVCQFGAQLGLLSMHLSRLRGGFKDSILIPRAGAAMTQLVDDDGDGDLDLFVLMTQADESLLRFENNGKAEFTETVLLKFPPVYGLTSFELMDFNSDGRLDIVLSNGDNADSSVIFKPYHGVRIFLNRGEGKFEEEYFYPLDGAYRVKAADFDGDGDLDLACIAFFTDFSRKPVDVFTYLENVGKDGRLEFVPKTFPGAENGRWLVMDTGDVDGDGDIDIVLGNYIRESLESPGEIPKRIQDIWKKRGSKFVLLRNRARKR